MADPVDIAKSFDTNKDGRLGEEEFAELAKAMRQRGIEGEYLTGGLMNKHTALAPLEQICDTKSPNIFVSDETARELVKQWYKDAEFPGPPRNISSLSAPEAVDKMITEIKARARIDFRRPKPDPFSSTPPNPLFEAFENGLGVTNEPLGEERLGELYCSDTPSTQNENPSEAIKTR